MVQKHMPDSQAKAGISLRDQFGLAEYDRAISSRRFRLATVRWVYIPVLVAALIAMILGLVFGWGSFGPVLGGAIGLFGAVFSVSQKAIRIQDDLEELVEERELLAAELRTSSAGVKDHLPG
ncbi:MAG: hypothetical protein PVJ76_19410 [Gemmatimonadota bacterium]|jgi:hypothetical protein